MKEIRESILNISPYVPGKPIEEVEKEYGIHNIIKLASNENPLGPSKKAILAMEQSAKEMNLYPDGNSTALKEELCKRFPVKMDEIVLGCGLDEVLKMLGEAFLNPGDEVIMANPSFSQYNFITELMGGKLISVPLDDTFAYDLKGIRESITDRTKLIFLCNPNNPTGTIIRQAEMDAFVESVPEHAFIIMDEAYHEFARDKELADTMKYHGK